MKETFEMKFVLLKVVNSNGAIVSKLIEAEDYEGSCKKSSNCFPFLEFCSENTADNYKEVIYIGEVNIVGDGEKELDTEYTSERPQKW